MRLSQFEQVSTIGRVIGPSPRIEEISPDGARRELLAVFPAFIVNMLLDAWAAAIGWPALVTSTVEEITGVPGTQVSRVGYWPCGGVSSVISGICAANGNLGRWSDQPGNREPNRESSDAHGNLLGGHRAE